MISMLQCRKWPASLCPTVGKKRIFYYLLSPHRNTLPVLNRKTNETFFKLDILVYCRFCKFIALYLYLRISTFPIFPSVFRLCCHDNAQWYCMCRKSDGPEHKCLIILPVKNIKFKIKNHLLFLKYQVYLSIISP